MLLSLCEYWLLVNGSLVAVFSSGVQSLLGGEATTMKQDYHKATRAQRKQRKLNTTCLTRTVSLMVEEHNRSNQDTNMTATSALSHRKIKTHSGRGYA